MIPTTMTALVHREYGGADVLKLESLSVPSPTPNQVLVLISAASLNPADIYLMQGQPGILRFGMGLRKPKPRVPGSDFAGEVVAVGKNVTDWKPGDRVFGAAATGSLAQFATARAGHIAHLPSGLNPAHAAASVMAALAAHDVLVAGGLDPAMDATGQQVLIIGGSGGIGSFAIQLAARAGAEVTAVCSTRNVERVRSLGAHAVVDYTQQDVAALTTKFDLIFDNVGATPMETLHALTSPTGVVLPNSGLPGPDGGAMSRVFKATVRRIFRRRRYRTFFSTPSRTALDRIAGQLSDGTIIPLLDSTVPLKRGAEAVARVASGHSSGKAIVAVSLAP